MTPEWVEGNEAIVILEEDLPGFDPAASGERQMAARQDPLTLAIMKLRLRALAADLQTLRAELLASGPAGFAAAGGDNAIDRMNAIETQLAALTNQTESLTNQIKRIVADGTNRIGDIEFRLCEQDPGCDLGALMTAELGGNTPRQIVAPNSTPDPDAAPSSTPVITATPLPPPETTAPESPANPETQAERADFDAAKSALDRGDLTLAADLFGQVARRHSGGPLTAEALFLRGAALSASGQNALAAEAWLEAFSADPNGKQAPATLMALSRAMATDADPREACPWLDELQSRFPSGAEAQEAATAARAAGCDATAADAASDG